MIAVGVPSAIKSGLPPVASSDARVIILGSLPGDASLVARQYYAHPSNQFWRLVGRAIDRDLGSLSYQARLAALRAARIGLWDVVESARRVGSLDQHIRDVSANDLLGWLARFPDLRAIAFNGAAAARTGRAIIGSTCALSLVDLPSSSAAYTIGIDRKAEAWSRLAVFLAD